jgi:hypothetical protein
MSSGSHKSIIVGVICLMMLSLAAFLVVPTECQADDIEIQVAPNVLSLQSNGVWVTVHADIAYSLVVRNSVSLVIDSGNDIAPTLCFADDLGNLVAKFPIWAVKELFCDEEGCYDDVSTFKLVGETVDGEEFSGIDVISVVNNDNGSKNK